MKSLILLSALFFSQLVFATEPPADYPVVRGVVRKVDLSAARFSVKHEEIPNLNMPGMTMSFAVQDPLVLKDLVVGDQIHFVADEVDGELTILWLEKLPPPNAATSKIFCTGIAETSPKTKVEIEIRPDNFSTIRYEHIEGPYIGTAQVNSIGRLHLHQQKDLLVYHAGPRRLSTSLVFKVAENKITDSCFTNFSAGMTNSSVECTFE
ncbi:MAG: copper-binding protein [Bdellovibrionales bacterium]